MATNGKARQQYLAWAASQGLVSPGTSKFGATDLPGSFKTPGFGATDIPGGVKGQKHYLPGPSQNVAVRPMTNLPAANKVLPQGLPSQKSVAAQGMTNLPAAKRIAPEMPGGMVPGMGRGLQENAKMQVGNKLTNQSNDRILANAFDTMKGGVTVGDYLNKKRRKTIV